jgi:hypothetical protein
MHPLHEREVLNVALLANGDESHGDEIRPAIFRLRVTTLLRILTPRATLLRAGKNRDELHAAAVVAITPTGKPKKRNINVRAANSVVRVSVIRRQTEMRDTEPSLQSFLSHQPTAVGWARLFC